MEIRIKRCQEEDLSVLGSSVQRLEFHQKRFQDQEKGDSIHLIAWLDGTPVGHLSLKFNGADEEYVKSRLGMVPELNAIGVDPPKMRSKGIGRKLIAEAENICREKGFEKVGLAVGVENKKAKKLYEALEYRDAEVGGFDIFWHETQEDGTKFKMTDRCIYMIKNL